MQHRKGRIMANKRTMVKGLDNVLAIRGGSPAVTRQAPAWPVVGDLEVAWMEAVVRSGQWSWLGPHETAFCDEFRSFIGSRYCLCLANGTVTLQCALQAVGVEPGDEVIVPGLTWCATAQAALDIGANVVFVDIDPETLCLDPKAVEKAITPAHEGDHPGAPLRLHVRHGRDHGHRAQAQAQGGRGRGPPARQPLAEPGRRRHRRRRAASRSSRARC